MPTTTDQLQRLIQQEIAQVRRSFRTSPEAGIDTRVALLECSRALDHFFVRPLLTQQPNDPSLCELYAGGGHLALTVLLDEAVDRTGVPLVPSVPDLHNWADSAIQHLGRVAQLQHLLELAKSGIATLSRTEDGSYRFTFADDLIDAEAFDVADQLWLRSLASWIDTPIRTRLAGWLPSILSTMRDLVYPWRGQYIGYHTTPEIDEHFLNAGIAWARTLDGQPELPGESMIGGHPFCAYRAAIGLLCGRALKHMSFAAELALLRPDLERRNFWSIWSTVDEWCDFLEASLDVDRTTARQLLSAMTLDRGYLTAFRSAGPAALPPLIQVSATQILMSLTGCLDAPFWFVLNKLRLCHRSDWDGIVDNREPQFRAEFLGILRQQGIRTSEHRVRVRQDRRIVTDIDAVALNAPSGRLLLCQLKWQDPFGRSMRARRSKMKNLITTANRWIEIVHDWCYGMSSEQLAAAVGLGGCTITRVELVVLVRHHARFTQEMERDRRAAWGTWAQACRIMAEECAGEDLIETLVKALNAEADRTDSPRNIPVGDLRVSSNLAVEVRRASPSSVSR